MQNAELEADFTFWFFIPGKKLFYSLENNAELLIVFRIHCLYFWFEVFMGCQQFSQPDKCFDNPKSPFSRLSQCLPEWPCHCLVCLKA